MNFGYQRGGGFNTQSAVTNLLMVNIIAFLITWVMGRNQYGMYYVNELLGLYIPSSELFRPWQLATHFFLHGDMWHLFFNMYALWLFGASLERAWGAKRFLTFYFVCAFGAAVVYLVVKYLEMQNATPQEMFIHEHIPVVGASGAVFGLLLGYGMLFPNSELMLLFFPVPIKAKYFVLGYGVLELFTGIQNNPADNVAHFAHLGGMLFGFIMIKIWQKDRNHFY